MRKGVATYSQDELVVVAKVCPRSKSVTDTLAPTTTAPVGSWTVPTMAPASFCAMAKGAPSKITARNKSNRETMSERRSAINGDIVGSFTNAQFVLPPGTFLGARGIDYPEMLRIATFYFVIYHPRVYTGRPEGRP